MPIAARRFSSSPLPCSCCRSPRLRMAGAVEQAMITQYYQSILHRAPKRVQLASWDNEITRLRNAGLDAKEVFIAMSSQFFDSAEYRGFNRTNAEYVTDLYQTFFQRPPDAGGLAYWQGQLTQAMPRGVVLSGFQFSAEFDAYISARLGSTPTRLEGTVVIDFYRGFLNRLPDDGGLNYWIGQLRQAQCTSASALSNGADDDFLAIPEQPGIFEPGADQRRVRRRPRIRRSFAAFADTASLQYWVTQLNNGATRNAVRHLLLTSVEFQPTVERGSRRRLLYDATYYVSSSSGSDANPGTQTAPWQTLAKVANSASLFKPGDSILLKRGDTWREAFNIQNQAGASGAPITYGAYGSGALPTVDSQQARTFGVYVNHVSHIVVRDIHTINATADGFYIGAGSGNVSNVVVQGVLSEYNARHGFSIEAAPGVTDVDAIEYRDATANRNGRAGFVAYNVSGGGATGIHYYASKATYNGQLSASHGFSAYFANNLHYHGVEAAFTNIDPATGQANAFLGGGEGIGIAFDDYVSNSSVEHSYSHDNGGTGIMLVHNGSNTTASYNVIANNGSFGLVVNGGGNGVSNVQVINNTVYGNKSYNGIAVWGTVNGLTIKNNIVVNNVGFGIGFSWTGITNYTVANNLIFGNTYPATEPGAYLSGCDGNDRG